LHLRIDNADERLTPIGRRIGLVGEDRWAQYLRKRSQREKLVAAMESVRVSSAIVPGGMAGDDRPTIATWLRRPEAKVSQILPWVRTVIEGEPVHGVLDTIETQFKYSGYIAQQERQVNRLRESDRREIPDDFCYTDIPGLSREVQERLERVRPTTLGRASAIPGVTPAAVAVLDVYLRVGR
jgi:tRNA uridine 5-carboxymethylaminomethyl modification enzyme